jgi:hypothetical protein
VRVDVADSKLTFERLEAASAEAVSITEPAPQPAA